jgi:hypothetical protein
MARSRVGGVAVRVDEPTRPGGVRIGSECLEWEVTDPDEASALRGLIEVVNGPSHPQPYLVEGPPGRFRLYVGRAAERVRTARGIR